MIKNRVLHVPTLLRELGLEPGDVLADLGSGGSGILTLAAARVVGDDGTIHAIDILDSALKALREKARLFDIRNLYIHKGNLENFSHMPLDDEHVDKVLLVNVMHQSKYPEKILKNALRLLRQGGKLLLINYTSKGASLYNTEPYTNSVCEKALDKMSCTLQKSLDLGDLYSGIIIEKV